MSEVPLQQGGPTVKSSRFWNLVWNEPALGRWIARIRGEPVRMHRLNNREFHIGNVLVRIHCIIEMIWWTGLVPWQFEIPFQEALCLPFCNRLTRAPASLPSPDGGLGTVALQAH